MSGGKDHERRTGGKGCVNAAVVGVDGDGIGIGIGIGIDLS